MFPSDYFTISYVIDGHPLGAEGISSINNIYEPVLMSYSKASGIVSSNRIS